MYFTPASSHTFSKFQNEKLLNLGQTRSALRAAAVEGMRATVRSWRTTRHGNDHVGTSVNLYGWGCAGYSSRPPQDRA